jgi:putative transposase
MTNHVHLVAIPAREDSLNLAVGRTHFVYTQYINRLRERSGHLWQGRFYSCPMDEAHTLQAMCYIERNPVRGRLARIPWLYRWSSAPAHAGVRSPAPLLDMEAWSALNSAPDWKAMLAKADDCEALARMRLNTRVGRPLASDSLLSKLERKLGRRLRPLPVGRPRKEDPDTYCQS